MEMPTNAPVRKVAAGGIAGAVVVIVMFLLSTFAPNVKIPQGLEAALTTVITFIVSYVVPPAANEAVLVDAKGDASSAKEVPATRPAAG